MHPFYGFITVVERQKNDKKSCGKTSAQVDSNLVVIYAQMARGKLYFCFSNHTIGGAHVKMSVLKEGATCISRQIDDFMCVRPKLKVVERHMISICADLTFDFRAEKSLFLLYEILIRA